ncbi:hypothetical protein, partial [Macrococcoides canis]|uniref:hypothetical protein n=1 Tax=Macrococcoides canis TaxID=1855823 RepID=UPI00105D0E7C
MVLTKGVAVVKPVLIEDNVLPGDHKCVLPPKPKRFADSPKQIVSFIPALAIIFGSTVTSTVAASLQPILTGPIVPITVYKVLTGGYTVTLALSGLGLEKFVFGDHTYDVAPVAFT